MKVLVTGANGYIGRHVVAALLDKGCDVVACDIVLEDMDKRATGSIINIFEKHADDLFVTLGSPDACVHLAWRNGFQHFADTQIGDLSSHYAFLTALISQGLGQLAVMSTMHEVGYWEGKISEDTPCNPMSYYGIAKYSLRQALTVFCARNNCILQWLRGYYILGDDTRNHSIFAKIVEAEKAGKSTFPFTSGKTKYDFIDIDELASQIAAVILQKTVAGVIDCCSGEPVSLGEKVEAFIRDNGFSIRLDYGAFPDRPYDSPVVYGDNAKIKQILGK